jgi:hypothetical protein
MVGVFIAALMSLVLAMMIKWTRHFEFTKATGVELDDFRSFLHLLDLTKNLFVLHLVLYIYSPFFVRNPATKRPDLSAGVWRAVVWMWTSIAVLVVANTIDRIIMKW